MRTQMRTVITTMRGEFLRLAQSLDALFPIGSYTLSNGMETYVQKGIVHDRATLEKHLSSYLYMISFGDLAFAAKVYSGYPAAELDELCSAAKAPKELRSGSIKQGIRFLKLVTELDSYPLLSEYKKMIESGACDGHYSIAMGLFMKEIGIDLAEGLALYSYSILSTMANHAVKLVPLRQMDGQKALFGVMPEITKATERAMEAQMDDIGASGCGFDIRSMQHESLYSRLYIS